MTAASHYFTPGADGSPSMFGREGWANDFTPKRHLVCADEYLKRCPLAGVHFWETLSPHTYVDSASALALCEKSAMGWIRSKGWHVEIDNEGLLILFTQDEDGEVYREKVIHPISGQPDWLGAARWVYGQENKTKPLTPE